MKYFECLFLFFCEEITIMNLTIVIFYWNYSLTKSIKDDSAFYLWIMLIFYLFFCMIFVFHNVILDTE